MTLVKNLMYIVMSLTLLAPAMAEEIEPQLVGPVTNVAPQNEFAKAILEVIAGMDMNEASRTGVLPNKEYNVTMPGYLPVVEGIPGVEDVAVYNIPQRFADLTTRSALCDVPQNGGCLVVEKDMYGYPTAYYLAVSYEGTRSPIRWFRKEVDMDRYSKQVEYILSVQGVDSQLYSQVSDQPGLIRDFDYASEEPIDDNTEKEKQQNEENELVDEEEIIIPEDPTNQDLAEKAEIKNAILHGCPYVRDEDGKKVYYQKRNKRTGKTIGRPYAKKLCPSEEIVKKHTPGMTEVTEAEAAALEAEAKEVFRKGKRSFEKVKASTIRKGMVTCYPIAKIEVKRPRVALGINFLWSPSRKKPDIQGKGKLLCYKGGKMTHRINLEMKYFYGPLGVALGIPEGTHYAAGLLSIGVAESPISLLTRKLPDGKLEIFREWVFIASAELNFGVGLGADAFGFSSGRQQRPIFNIISGSARKGVLGAGVSLFNVGRIGLDPDDF